MSFEITDETLTDIITNPSILWKRLPHGGAELRYRYGVNFDGYDTLHAALIRIGIPEEEMGIDDHGGPHLYLSKQAVQFLTFQEASEDAALRPVERQGPDTTAKHQQRIAKILRYQTRAERDEAERPIQAAKPDAHTALRARVGRRHFQVSGNEQDGFIAEVNLSLSKLSVAEARTLCEYWNRNAGSSFDVELQEAPEPNFIRGRFDCANTLRDSLDRINLDSRRAGCELGRTRG